MTEQLNAGIELMLVGMGIVFLFLAMLIVTVNLMSVLVLRYFPQQESPTTGNRGKTSEAGEQTVIAAITAAIHQYRTKHK